MNKTITPTQAKAKAKAQCMRELTQYVNSIDSTNVRKPVKAQCGKSMCVYKEKVSPSSITISAGVPLCIKVEHDGLYIYENNSFIKQIKIPSYGSKFITETVKQKILQLL